MWINIKEIRIQSVNNLDNFANHVIGALNRLKLFFNLGTGNFNFLTTHFFYKTSKHC